MYCLRAGVCAGHPGVFHRLQSPRTSWAEGISRRTTLGPLTARDPFLREAGKFSGRPWAGGSESSNPEGTLSPPSTRRIRNTAAFHILPGPLTPRAQTSAGPRSPGRCQRAGAVRQAAPPRGRPEPAPSEGPGGGCRRGDWPAPPAPQGLRQRRGPAAPFPPAWAAWSGSVGRAAAAAPGR